MERRERKASARTLMIAIVVIVGVMSLAQPLHQWWEQQREYDALTYQLEQEKERNTNLKAQLERWSDKEYIASQARARLQMVQPGETQYTLVDPPPGTAGAGGGQMRPQGPARPWYLTFADSVDAASDPDPVLEVDPSETETKPKE